jgi:hypothetical protein
MKLLNYLKVILLKKRKRIDLYLTTKVGGKVDNKLKIQQRITTDYRNI